MPRLDADAALFVVVSELLKEDATILERLPGGSHLNELPLKTPYPALCWTIKGGLKDKNFGLVATQHLKIWFKVNTEANDVNPMPYAGAAANARLRELFDGSGDQWRPIKNRLEPKLREYGWHLQGICEEAPIPSSTEPLGESLTEFVTVVGGIYCVMLQPIPLNG